MASATSTTTTDLLNSGEFQQLSPVVQYTIHMIVNNTIPGSLRVAYSSYTDWLKERYGDAVPPLNRPLFEKEFASVCNMRLA